MAELKTGLNDTSPHAFQIQSHQKQKTYRVLPRNTQLLLLLFYLSAIFALVP